MVSSSIEDPGPTPKSPNSQTSTYLHLYSALLPSRIDWKLQQKLTPKYIIK